MLGEDEVENADAKLEFEEVAVDDDDLVIACFEPCLGLYLMLDNFAFEQWLLVEEEDKDGDGYGAG